MIIIFDEDHNNKETDKNETPDEKDGVEIRKKERPEATKDSCSSHPIYEDLCDDHTCTPITEGESIPGGPLRDITHVSTTGSGIASHTSRILDNNNSEYNSSWLTTAHGICGTGFDVYHQLPRDDDFESYKIGTVAEIHEQYDVAVIEPHRGDEGVLAANEVADVRDLHTGPRFEITHTASEDGVYVLMNEGNTIWRFDPMLCYNDGEIDGIVSNQDIGSCGTTGSGPIIEIEGMDGKDGASGSLHFAQYDGDFYGVSMHRSSRDPFLLPPTSLGIAGYEIHNELGYYWK